MSNLQVNSQIRSALLRGYDNVNLALWALLIAGLIFFAVLVVPHLSAARAQYAMTRAHEIEAEDASYCDKWGMAPASTKHRTCVVDLEQFRRSVEQRLADETLL